MIFSTYTITMGQGTARSGRELMLDKFHAYEKSKKGVYSKA
jgi:hypothetical protein